MGNLRRSTLLMVAGGLGLLLGRILLVSSPPDPAWTKDGDRLIAYALTILLLGLVVWHQQRFGAGKLLLIAGLAAGAFLTAVLDPGDGPPVWSRSYTGDELAGISIFIASAAIVLVGVAWSHRHDRPDDAGSFWSLLLDAGLPGHTADSADPGCHDELGRQDGIVGRGSSPAAR